MCEQDGEQVVCYNYHCDYSFNFQPTDQLGNGISLQFSVFLSEWSSLFGLQIITSVLSFPVLLNLNQLG